MEIIPLYIGLGLLAGLCWAVSTTIMKSFLTNRVDSPLKLSFFVFGISTFISLFLILTGKISVPKAQVLIVIISAGVTYFLAGFLFLSALKRTEASRLSAVIRLQTLFALILATIFLGEVFSPGKYVGITMILAGTIAVSKKKKDSVLVPDKPFWITVAAAFLFGAHLVILKHATGSTSYWNVFFWSRLGAFGLSGLVIASPVINYSVLETLKLFYAEKGERAALGEFFNSLGVLVSTAAVSLGPASLVAAAGSTQPLFVLVISGILGLLDAKSFTEDLSPKKLVLKIISALLIIVGIYLIS